MEFSYRGFCAASQGQAFGNMGTLGVVLVSRQRDGCQNADDRDDDHQFDQGKTLLSFLNHVVPLLQKFEKDVTEKPFCNAVAMLSNLSASFNCKY